MSWSRRDDIQSSRRRSSEERERARQERAARREGRRLPDPGELPEDEVLGEDALPPEEPEPVAEDPPPHDPEPVAEVPPPFEPQALPTGDEEQGEAHAQPPVEEPAPVPVVRIIQPEPPSPPAPAGTLPDPTEKPLGTRRAGRPRRGQRRGRPVVTPPADVPRGPARAQPRRGRIVLGVIGLLFVVVVAGALNMLFQPFAGDPGPEVRVEIPEGADAGRIGDVLADAGVVDSSMAFELRATLSGKRDELRSGDYTLNEDSRYGDVIDELSAAPVAEEPEAVTEITIPEGRSRREVAPVVEEEGIRGDYLKASARAKGSKAGGITLPEGNRSLEGMLFPATYEVAYAGGAEALVQQQLATFRESFKSVDLRRARRENLSAYDVVTIASMVEREARIPRERAIIAAVIYNRRDEGIPLGIDATTRYETNNWDRPITQAELDKDTEYNTRRRAGLPPTPIGNPGLASLRAAAKPADVDFLYFVVKPGTCGEHAFSATFEEFQADERRYNAERERRGGKSPSNC